MLKMARFVRIKILEPDCESSDWKKNLVFKGKEILINEDEISMIAVKDDHVEVWTKWSGDVPAYNTERELLNKLRINW